MSRGATARAVRKIKPLIATNPGPLAWGFAVQSDPNVTPGAVLPSSRVNVDGFELDEYEHGVTCYSFDPHDDHEIAWAVASARAASERGEIMLIAGAAEYATAHEAPTTASVITRAKAIAGNL